MKTNTTLPLSAAAVLATFFSLGAANPDVGSRASLAVVNDGIVGAVDAVADAVNNVGKSARAQEDDLLKAIAEPSVRPADVEAGTISGERPSFEFTSSGRAAEEWAKLDKSQKADLNRLGTKLVDFALEREGRIEKNRTETISRLQDVRKPVEETTHAEYNRARDARIRAGSELSALKNEREIAELHLAEAQKRLAEAEKGKADVTRRIEHADEYIRDIKRDIEKSRDEAESAGRDLLRAQNELKGREDALSSARTSADEAKKDRDAKKAAAAAAAKRAADAKTAAVAAEKAFSGKETARDAAEKDLGEKRQTESAATRALKSAEGALASAEDKASRLARRKDAATGAVQTATAARDAAAAVLAETQKKAAEPKGWFSRHLVPGWFQPSVPRAERRLEAAKQGVQDAADRAKAATDALVAQERAVQGAKAARDAAKKNLDKAAKDRASAEQNLKKAADEFDAAKTEAETKERARKAANADAAKAEKVLSAAEGVVLSKDKAVSDAEARRSEAEGVVGKAEEGLATVRAKAGELEKAKGPAEQAAIIYRDPLADAEKAVVAARRELETRQSAVDNLGERGAELNRKQAAYDEAKKAEDGHRPAWEKARRELDNVRAEAIRLVAEDERKTREANEKLEDDLWAGLERQLTSRNTAEAGRGAEKTGADAGRAAEDAKAAVDAAVKAEADAKSARKAAEDFRRGGWKAARASAEKAGAGLEKAERAFLDAAKAVEKAKGGKDAEALSAANADLAKAREAVSGAKTVQEGASKELAKARDELASLERKAKEAEEAVPAAKGRARAAEAARKEAEGRDEANRRAVADSSARAARSVAILRKAFDQQVDDMVNRRRPEEQAGIDVDRMGAREIQEAYRDFMRSSAYRGARDAYARARENLNEYAQETNRVAVWSGDPRGKVLVAEFRKAREAYAPFREKRAELEDRYNAFFSEATFRTAPTNEVSDAAADARHETEAARRDLHGYRVKGDRRWLARTSVRPAFADRDENLLDVLLDEFSWQADRLAEAGEAKRGEGDPLRVDLSDGQAAECAAAAALALKRRAIYSGFYFCGADPSEEGEERTLWVDKGRFGPATVYFGSFDPESGYFVPDQDEAGVDVESGRMYSSADILAKFASKDAPTNTLEGEAFNFISFRQRFNELNANADIKRTDVKFEPAEGFDYGYDDTESGWGVEDVATTNRMTRAIRTVVNVQENRRPAPIHGVLSIDNFNSMGDADQIATVESLMLRALLQRRLGLFSDEDSLAVQGNWSPAGLYGGAASYFVPRDPEARVWRRGDLADSLAWTVHGGYTEVDQGDVIPDLDVLGTGYYAGLQLSTRVADTGRGTWDVSAGVTYRSVENSVRIAGETIDLGPNGGDPYTLLPLSLALMYADKDLDSWRGRNYATVELAYNLGVGGSTADELAAFRPAIDEDRYAILRAQFARLQLLWEGSKAWWVPRMLFLRADAQYAFEPVIGAEQFGLGGHGTVRGYVEREFMGDQGLSASIEFRTPILLNPAWFEPRKKNPWRSDEQLQLVYFFDFGWYNLQDATSRGDDDNILLGLGLGLRYSLEDWRVLGRDLSPVFRLDWAYPVWQQNDVADDATSSAGVIHASLQFPF